MKLLRLARRALFVAALLSLALLLTVLLFLRTPWGRGRARNFIVSQANKVLNGTLEIGRVEGTFLSGIQLHEVILRQGPTTPVRAARMDVHYSAWQLIRGEAIIIDRLDISGLTIAASRAPTGALNLANLVKRRTTPSGQTGPRRPITIHDINIEQGALTFADPWGPSWMTLPRRIWDLSASLGVDYRVGRLSLPIRSLRATTAMPEFMVQSFTGTLWFSGSSWGISNGKLRSKGSIVDFSMALGTEGTRRTYDVGAAAAAFDFPEMSRIVPGLKTMRVPARVSVSMRGPEDWVETRLSMSSASGDVNGDLHLDMTQPGWRGAGKARLVRFDISKWLPTDTRSEITGETEFDLLLGIGRHFPRGTFTFSGPRVVYAEYEAASLRAKGRVTEHRAEIAQGAGVAYGSPVEFTGWIGLPAPFAFHFSGKASGLDLRRLPDSVPVPKVPSNLFFAYDAQGQFRSPFLAGQAIFTDSSILGARLLSGASGSIDSSASPIRYSGQGVIQNLELAAIGDAFDVTFLRDPRYAGRVSGDFIVRGEGSTLEQLSLDLESHAGEAILFHGRFAELALDLHVRTDTLTGRGAGLFERIDPSAITEDVRHAGELSGRFDLSGSMPALFTTGFQTDTAALEGSVSLAHSRLSDVDIEYASATGMLRDGRASFDMLKGTTSVGEIEGKGRIALTQGDSDFSYDAAVSDLSRVSSFTPMPMSGAVTLKGRLTGTADRIRTEGTFESSNLEAGSIQALSASGDYRLDSPAGSLAEMRVDGSASASFVSVFGRSFGTATAKLSYADERLTGNVETHLPDGRVVRLSGNLLVHVDHRELHLAGLRLQLGEQTWQLPESANDAVVAWSADAIQFRDIVLSAGAGASGRLSVNGELGRRVPASGLSIDVRDVALEGLAVAAPMLAEYRGRLGGSVQIYGTVSHPEVHIGLRVSEGRFRQFDFRSLAVLARWTVDDVEGDVLLEQQPGVWLSVRGGVPSNLFSGSGSPRPINLTIRSSRIDLAVIQGVTSAVRDVSGVLEINVTGKGPSSNPHFDGFVDIAGATFLVPATGVRYKNGVAHVALAGESITVQNLRLEDANGDAVEATGSASTRELRLGEVGLELSATRFAILQNDLGVLDINGVFTLTGTVAAPVISGDLAIERASLRVDRLLAVLQRPYATRSALEKPPSPASVLAVPMPTLSQLWDRLTLRLRMLATNNLTIRGDDLRFSRGGGVGLGDVNATFGGDLSVRKSPGARVAVSGTLQTVRGSYAFQGRRFAIDPEGTIRFLGDDAEPFISVTARRVVSGVEVRVALQGRATAPELQLTSSPALEETDILSLLLFNQPANELVGAQRQQLAIQAAGLAGGFVVSPAVSAIREALGFDVLELEPTSDSAGAGVRLSAGRELWNGLFVTYGREFGQNEYNEFLVEYALSRYLRVRANASDVAGIRARSSLFRRVERAGIDLLFFFSY